MFSVLIKTAQMKKEHKIPKSNPTVHLINLIQSIKFNENKSTFLKINSHFQFVYTPISLKIIKLHINKFSQIYNFAIPSYS